jgi:hypothetical protein
VNVVVEVVFVVFVFLSFLCGFCGLSGVLEVFGRCVAKWRHFEGLFDKPTKWRHLATHLPNTSNTPDNPQNPHKKDKKTNTTNTTSTTTFTLQLHSDGEGETCEKRVPERKSN